MTHAYIADTVRTPRGRGNDKGSLKPVKPAELLAQALRALAERTALDTAQAKAGEMQRIGGAILLIRDTRMAAKACTAGAMIRAAVTACRRADHHPVRGPCHDRTIRPPLQ